MNILTAEEWLSNNKEMSIYDAASYDEGGYCGIDEKALYKIMIEFAKMHVEAQCSEICHQMDLQLEHSQEAQEIVNNTYPLTNIK